MIRTTFIKNDTQKKRLVFVEPEARDFWLLPGEEVELRAEVDSAEANFEFSVTDDGLRVFPLRGMDSISVYCGGVELELGYHRPDDYV